MYYGIFDEKKVTNLNLKGNKSILIRIFDPNSTTHPKIINELDYQKILELYIPDYVTKPETKELEEIFTKLNKFILDNDFNEIIIHCSMGISRSPAIMICIARIINNTKLEQEIKEKYRFYNKFIINEFKNYPYITKNLEKEKPHKQEFYENHQNPKKYNNLIITEETPTTINITIAPKTKKLKLKT